MKKILLLALVLYSDMLHAQVGGTLKRLGNTAKSTTENKADEKVATEVGNALDNVFGKKKKGKKSGEEVQETTPSSNEETLADGKTGVAPKAFKAYSKFDFIPGEKIVFSENFEGEAIGEMPVKWTTSGKGELMELEGIPGTWLRGFKGSQLMSMSTKDLGENYTIEFDLLYYFEPKEAVYVMPDLVIRMLNNYRQPQSGNPRNGETSFTLNIHPKPSPNPHPYSKIFLKTLAVCKILLHSYRI